MAMSSKKIGKMVTADVDKALANISASTPKPDMKDDTLAKATAPKKAPSFGEAFKAARAAGDKTFSWAGKSYTTNVAGEGAKRPATASAPAKKPETPKAADVSASTRSFMSKLSLAPKAETRTATKPRTSKDRSAEARERMGKFFSSLNPYNQADAKGKAGKPLILTGEAARKANKGTVGGYAKGGKIDGCAIRGKTRAPMKKGK